MNLYDRIYECVHCGLVIDRDLNAAINIEKEGVPTVRRESTPADTLAATLAEYNSIPYVRASMVVETGSSAVIVKPTIFIAALLVFVVFIFINYDCGRYKVIVCTKEV